LRPEAAKPPIPAPPPHGATVRNRRVARGIVAEPPSGEAAKVMERIARRKRASKCGAKRKHAAPAKRLAQMPYYYFKNLSIIGLISLLCSGLRAKRCINNGFSSMVLARLKSLFLAKILLHSLRAAAQKALFSVHQV
jgi:hypothetical protein